MPNEDINKPGNGNGDQCICAELMTARQIIKDLLDGFFILPVSEKQKRIKVAAQDFIRGKI